MQKNPTAPWQPANPTRLAKQFSRLGWIAFWLQLALLSIPMLLLMSAVGRMLLVLMATPPPDRGSDYLDLMRACRARRMPIKLGAVLL